MMCSAPTAGSLQHPLRHSEQPPVCCCIQSRCRNIPDHIPDKNPHDHHVLHPPPLKTALVYKMACTLAPRHWRRHRADSGWWQQVTTRRHTCHEPTDQLPCCHGSMFHLGLSRGLFQDGTEKLQLAGQPLGVQCPALPLLPSPGTSPSTAHQHRHTILGVTLPSLWCVSRGDGTYSSPQRADHCHHHEARGQHLQRLCDFALHRHLLHCEHHPLQLHHHVTPVFVLGAYVILGATFLYNQSVPEAIQERNALGLTINLSRSKPCSMLGFPVESTASILMVCDYVSPTL